LQIKRLPGFVVIPDWWDPFLLFTTVYNPGQRYLGASYGPCRLPVLALVAAGGPGPGAIRRSPSSFRGPLLRWSSPVAFPPMAKPPFLGVIPPLPSIFFGRIASPARRPCPIRPVAALAAILHLSPMGPTGKSVLQARRKCVCQRCGWAGDYGFSTRPSCSFSDPFAFLTWREAGAKTGKVGMGFSPIFPITLLNYVEPRLFGVGLPAKTARRRATRKHESACVAPETAIARLSPHRWGRLFFFFFFFFLFFFFFFFFGIRANPKNFFTCVVPGTCRQSHCCLGLVFHFL